jgi:V/A-type H+-transporting ATPase subunit C
MSRLADFAFLNTRVSLHAAMLEPVESLSPFIETADSVPPDYLGRIGVDLPADQGSISPALLEQSLMTTLVEDALRIRHAMPPQAQRLVTQWMRRFELINLKSLIRCKLTNCDVELTRDYLLDLGSFASLPLQRLLNSEDIDEFLRVLAEHDSLLTNRIRDYIGDPQQLFLVEAAVDYHFYTGLFQRCCQLSSEEEKSIRSLVGRLIDQVNLVWILRYRLAYDLHPPHTYFMLVRTGLKITRSHLAKLASLNDLDEIRELLPVDLGRCLEGEATLQQIERRIQQITLAHARHLLRHEHFHLGRALAYLYLRERQLNELHQVIKGKLLGFSPALIRESLFGEAA